MRLSVTIMAHPDRAAEAYELRNVLDHPARISFDDLPRSKDPEQRWANGRRAWELHDDYADYHLVLQDDAAVGPNLVAGLSNALTVLGPKGLMSAFTGTGSDLGTQGDGSPWLWMLRLHWGLAVAAPVSTISEMLDWCDQRQGLSYHERVGRYYLDILGWRCWYAYPSLVDHRTDLRSLIGTQHRGRATEVVGDAKAVDWSQRPPGMTYLLDSELRRYAR